MNPYEPPQTPKGNPPQPKTGTSRLFYVLALVVAIVLTEILFLVPAGKVSPPANAPAQVPPVAQPMPSP